MGGTEIIVVGTSLILFAAFWIVAFSILGRFKAGFSAAVALLSLVLGAAFLVATDFVDEGLAMSKPAILAIWIVACLAIVAFDLRRMKNAANRPAAAGSLVDENIVQDTDVGTRLRKLEALRKEGLITDREHRQKRTEILQEKW